MRVLIAGTIELAPEHIDAALKGAKELIELSLIHISEPTRPY